MSNTPPGGRVAVQPGAGMFPQRAEYEDLIARCVALLGTDKVASRAYIKLWEEAVARDKQVSIASLSEWAVEHGRKHGTAGQRGVAE